MEYLSLLGNVDDSILGIELGSEFVIEKMDIDDFAHYCENEFFIADVWQKIDHDWGCMHGQNQFLRPNYVYVIKKTLIEYPAFIGDSDDMDAHADFWNEERNFQDNVSSYIQSMIGKLRLLAEGTIKISIEFYYKVNEGSREIDSSREDRSSCENRLFSLNADEVIVANNFLSKGIIKTKHKYLKFSLESFEQSYQVSHREFEFLSLMISLESLLNDGNTELRFRVSRGSAVLIGETKEHSQKIFKLVKELYDKRSILVHTGDKSKINEDDILNLKNIVRKALKKSVDLNIPKANLSKHLMESGFGSAV